MNRKAQIAASVLVVFLAISAFQVFLVRAANVDSWTAKQPMPMASWGIASVNDKIYLIACSGDYANVSYTNNAVLEYDPLLDLWSVKKADAQGKAQFCHGCLPK